MLFAWFVLDVCWFALLRLGLLVCLWALCVCLLRGFLDCCGVRCLWFVCRVGFGFGVLTLFGIAFVVVLPVVLNCVSV